MSAEVVNLRQFRKKATRAEKERQADENRIRFGRTKAERQHEKAITELEDRRHEAGRIEPKDEDG